MGRSVKNASRGMAKELYVCPRCRGKRVVVRGRIARPMGHVKTMFCAKCKKAMPFARVA